MAVAATVLAAPVAARPNRTLPRPQAEADDIVLLSADEPDVQTHPHLAHAWGTRGAGLRVPAPGQSRPALRIDRP